MFTRLWLFDGGTSLINGVPQKFELSGLIVRVHVVTEREVLFLHLHTIDGMYELITYYPIGMYRTILRILRKIELNVGCVQLISAID